jgi:Fe-S cluster assembly iron-binding protein IscA
LTLEESALKSDEIIEQDGISFLVNDGDKVYFDHTKLDYVKSLLGGGQFKILQI